MTCRSQAPSKVDPSQVAVRPMHNGDLVLVHKGKVIHWSQLVNDEDDNVSSLVMIRFVSEFYRPALSKLSDASVVDDNDGELLT